MHSIQLRHNSITCGVEPTVQQVVAEYSSPGECFVFEACNLELHGYRRENYGCAGIEYER